VCIAVGWTHKEFKAFRADIGGNYRKTLDLAPELAARVDQGKRAERFVGTADVPNFFRQPAQSLALCRSRSFSRRRISSGF
jgi:hypothetical protein